MEDKGKYPLTLEHVKQYLATKQDCELVGACYNALWCLLTETLNYHYSEQKPWRVDVNKYSSPGIDGIDLSEPLMHLLLTFDHQSHRWGKDISKSQFRRYLTHYLKDHEAPFTLSDLFEDTKA